MCTYRRIILMALLVSLVSALLAQQPPVSPLPDFAKARDEGIGFLQGLIRIDTSNGNESKAAEYIK